jgi:hypothetical protein
VYLKEAEVLKKYWILGVVTLLFASPSFAQQSTDAVILGTVTDARGTAVAGASVTVISAETSAKTLIQTDEHGEYRTPPLHIGRYNVNVEAPGFKQFSVSGLSLSLGDVRKIDAALQVGEVSQTITVTAADTVLSTSDSTSGTVIGNDQIAELPLGSSNGRDYLQLATLSAGTAPPIAGVGISIPAGRDR